MTRLRVLALAPLVLSATACTQRTDTTIDVAPNARVQIQNFAGAVTVRTWDRNAVRVVATPKRRNQLRIREQEGGLAIASVSKSGVPEPLQCEVTVPARASLDIGGTYTDISIDGARGSVSATTVQGGVSLRGGNGMVSLKSVEGAVTVQNATGRIEVNGVNKGLTLRNVNGDISAETVNGSIVLDSIESADVEAVTVNGKVTYEGAIRDHGRYRFGTHNGPIVVSVPERANATIAALTYQGTFSSQFALPPSASSDSGSAHRKVNVVLGTGSARIDAESFQGSIVLARPGDAIGKPKE